MSIGPEDIERAVFKERFRGYDTDQVDRFLDQLAGSLAALRAERDQLAAELEAVRGGAGPVPGDRGGADGVDGLIKRTLTAAQRTAEELVADARRQAATIVEDAHSRAAAERRGAQMEAELVRRAVAQLRDFRAEYRERLHAIVAEQLAALDRAGELPSLPPMLAQVVDAAPVPPSEPVVARQPNPARQWAQAAAEDTEAGPEPEPVEPEGHVDELASPWDDLWQSTSPQTEVADGPRAGMETPGGGMPEPPPRGATTAERAGDA